MVPSRLNRPPAAAGLQMSASSKRLAGGKVRPPLCAIKPVALQTAVISMPDLVPSRKELNIFGLMSLDSSTSRYCLRTSQTVSGVREW